VTEGLKDKVVGAVLNKGNKLRYRFLNAGGAAPVVLGSG